jgi:uncharacterized protein YndB with AHSA1/START domain
VADIVHLLHIRAPIERVYAALTQIDGLRSWWTPQSAGRSEVGLTLTFDFDDRYHNEMQVQRLEPNRFVLWECLVGDEEWIGTKLGFALSPAPEGTILRFRHGGWNRESDFFASCNTQWGHYLRSLACYCETGQGTPYGGSD